MSLADPIFESSVITLLKGIYDNIGSGLPYTSICGKFTQQNDGDVYPIDYRILSNTTGYDINIGSGGAGIVDILIDTIVRSKNVVLFVGPLIHPTTVASKELRGEEPIIYRLVSTNTGSSSPDSRGFGSTTGDYVEFELRFYTEV
jgi:hypothetical protein